MLKKNYNIGIVCHNKITRDYSFEIQLFARIRRIKDGLTFFNFKVNLDLYESDHKPSFEVELTILNIHNHFLIYRTQ